MTSSRLSNWNYRMIATTDGNNEVLIRLGIVYYDSNMNPISHSDTDAPVGDDVDEIQEKINRMNEATDKPILWGDEGKWPKEYVKQDFVIVQPENTTLVTEQDDEHIHEEARIDLADQELSKDVMQSDLVIMGSDSANEKFLKCPNCGKKHFRHTGCYVALIPFLENDNNVKVADNEARVMMCIGCKSSYIMSQGKIVDVSDEIDLDAWKKAEKTASKVAGPGMAKNYGTSGC